MTSDTRGGAIVGRFSLTGRSAVLGWPSRSIASSNITLASARLRQARPLFELVPQAGEAARVGFGVTEPGRRGADDVAAPGKVRAGAAIAGRESGRGLAPGRTGSQQLQGAYGFRRTEVDGKGLTPGHTFS